MGPLALALALLAVPASAQVRNERGCTAKQQAKIEAAMPEARARVAAALKAVKAKDPKAVAAGKVMIGDGYNEAEVGGVLELMAAALAGPETRCSTAADKQCGNRAGYVRSDMRNTIFFCPKFFAEEGSPTPAEQRIRTVVHESAHLAHPNIREDGGESYCVVFSCLDSCGDGPTDPVTGKSVPARVADNWSQFAHCAAGKPADEDDVIVVSPKKKDGK
jgi:hypothetical protein